jgi:hypothetical protein
MTDWRSSCYEQSVCIICLRVFVFSAFCVNEQNSIQKFSHSRASISSLKSQGQRRRSADAFAGLVPLCILLESNRDLAS